MRVSLLILGCSLAMAGPASGQLDGLHEPYALGGLRSGSMDVPIGSDGGIEQLEKAALLGDRKASALLAIMLQERPEMAGGLLKSAIHFQVAIASGCSDLGALAARALERLSPDERTSFDLVLPHWVPAVGTQTNARSEGPCLSW